MPALNGILPNKSTGATGSGLTVVSTLDDYNVGTLQWVDNKCYKWVKLLNTAGVLAAAGDPVGYTADKYDVHQVCTKVSEMDAPAIPGGVLMAAVTSAQTTTGVFLWIQVKGAATVNAALAGSPAAGNAMILVTTDLTLTKSTNLLDFPFGYAQDVANKQIVLDCPF